MIGVLAGDGLAAILNMQTFEHVFFLLVSIACVGFLTFRS